MKTIDEGIDELQKLLEANVQYWLLGAGASFDSKIPLMYPLTERVRELVAGPLEPLLGRIQAELPLSAHIEHILSHIGDLIAIASRNRTGRVHIGGNECDLADLVTLHEEIIGHIATTVRYGYRPASGPVAAEVGTLAEPIVEVEHHQAFVQALFEGRANLESRSRVTFITTNYDTLLEDSLALSRRSVYDGFTAGGVGYWLGHKHEPIEKLPPRTHQLIKLHGSVDWLRSSNGGMVRGRYGTKYLSDLSQTLIYPQATKYVETQKDPFADLFDAFRRSMAIPVSHLLCTVGYSFGDEHINLEIETALSREGNKTNVIAFSKEVLNGVGPATMLPETLERWRQNPVFGSRVYIASDKALYAGKTMFEPDPIAQLAWWSFAGLTRFLKSGAAV